MGENRGNGVMTHHPDCPIGKDRGRVDPRCLGCSYCQSRQSILARLLRSVLGRGAFHTVSVAEGERVKREAEWRLEREKIWGRDG